MRPNEKRLVLEIDRALHTSIKMAATQSHMTIKNWLIKAIATQLLLEQGESHESNLQVKTLPGITTS